MSLTGLGEAAQAVTTIAEAATGLVNHFFPDKTVEQKAQIASDMQDMMNQYNLVSGQLKINEIEAASTNWFVAGWRPFIGWTCGSGLLYQFLFMPIMNGIIRAVLLILGHEATIELFVSLDISTLISCVGGLLGLGSLRTYEKFKGVEKNR